MKYVYYIYEKSDDPFDLEGLAIYETFEKAVQITKELVKKELEYMNSTTDEENLEIVLSSSKEKQIFIAKIVNDEETFYTAIVRKVPFVS